ncbi:MAG: MoxR family ATPase [Candidatus Woesearchaeota archaeon]
MDESFQKALLGKDPFTDILGLNATKEQLKSALLMNRNVLIIGPPGIGKTTLAKNVAKIMGAAEDKFVRVQGSPDLTVEDLLGDIDPIKALKFGPTSREAFTPGKIFRADGGVLFFDELNRCPEKVQNALLQVLEEGKATIGNYLVDFPAKFVFIGTMNPEETAATEKLSDVLMDRFDIVHMTYPDTPEIEKEIVLAKGKKKNVTFPDELLVLAIQFVRELRESKDLQKKPSVRASIGLYERAQANAMLRKAKAVSAEDISNAVISVLSHRIELKPSIKYLQTTEEFISREFSSFAQKHKELERGDGL